MSVTVMSVTKNKFGFWPVEKKIMIYLNDQLIQMEPKSILYKMNYCLILYYLPVEIVWTFNFHHIVFFAFSASCQLPISNKIFLYLVKGFSQICG